MQFELLQKLLPHEMRHYVIETLDVRLHGQQSGGTSSSLDPTSADLGDQLVRLSDHRALLVHRGSSNQPTEEASANFAVFSTSCRLGWQQDGTLVLGQACIRPSTSIVKSDDLTLSVKVTLPKDLSGTLRRDAVEEKQNQVQTFIHSKLRPCINFKCIEEARSGDGEMREQDQIDSSSIVAKVPKLNTPLELHIHLHVIQDNQKDGNLHCAFLATANDLLLQIAESCKSSKQ